MLFNIWYSVLGSIDSFVYQYMHNLLTNHPSEWLIRTIDDIPYDLWVNTSDEISTDLQLESKPHADLTQILQQRTGYNKVCINFGLPIVDRKIC